MKVNNKSSLPIYGRIYICDHPLYDACTLFEFGEKGIAVIQQRFDPKTKHTWWGPIDDQLRDDIYLTPAFEEFCIENASVKDVNGLYFTIPVRRLMHAIGMKPLNKQEWETRF